MKLIIKIEDSVIVGAYGDAPVDLTIVETDSNVNGVTLPQPGMADDAKPGASLGSAMGGFGGSGFGCGRHRPGPLAGVYGAERVAPSSLRSASMASAAARPAAMPSCLACPSGILDRAVR